MEATLISLYFAFILFSLFSAIGTTKGLFFQNRVVVIKQRKRVHSSSIASDLKTPLSSTCLPDDPIDPIQKKKRVLNVLKRQLNILGYLSSSDQLGFANRILNSQRSSFDEVNLNEIKFLLQAIHRVHRYSHCNSSPTPIASILLES